MTNVNAEALSDLCILVTSQMVIGLLLNPQGSQFSVVSAVVHMLWNVATVFRVCYCVYVRNLLFICLH
jgi:hypothetical protein